MHVPAMVQSPHGFYCACQPPTSTQESLGQQQTSSQVDRVLSCFAVVATVAENKENKEGKDGTLSEFEYFCLHQTDLLGPDGQCGSSNVTYPPGAYCSSAAGMNTTGLAWRPAKARNFGAGWTKPLFPLLESE